MLELFLWLMFSPAGLLVWFVGTTFAFFGVMLVIEFAILTLKEKNDEQG